MHRALREADAGQLAQTARSSELLQRFDEVVAVLLAMSVEDVWEEATDRERRILVEELVENVAIFPDHLEVSIAGAPKMNVTL